ncbi:MAG: hypothetical protein IJZ19_06550 [Lentisphaeria bacterium]|nr:hypothetical protein [Lentisphaeria bacterium]
MSDVFGKSDITWSQVEREIRRIVKRVQDDEKCLQTILRFEITLNQTRLYRDQMSLTHKTMSKLDTALENLKDEIESLATFEERQYITLNVYCYSQETWTTIDRNFQIQLTVDFIYG